MTTETNKTEQERGGSIPLLPVSVLDRATIVAILREHIYVDATGLAPAVVWHYVTGFEAAAEAILAAGRTALAEGGNHAE